MAGIVAKQRHFIITGVSGVGKTTLVKAIVQELNKEGISCHGFLTEEVRNGGRRIGFDVITMSGQRGQLARLRDDSGSVQGARQKYMVGQYAVNLLSFEQTALPSLLSNMTSKDQEHSRNVFVIDEIGKMELFSQSFVQTVERLMSHSSCVVIATIPVPKGKPIPLVERIRNSPMSRVYEVTRQNRDGILKELMPSLISHIKDTGHG